MRIGVALGSGAARGLAHISYIEALDELGLQPSIIAGSSIGALIGSGWASGMTGAELREHAYDMLGSLRQIATTLWTRNRPNLRQIMESGLSVQMNSLGVANAFLPDGFPEDFGGLKVPFHVVSTDYYSWSEVVFSTGPLLPAIAASMAIPSVFRPVALNGSYFLDGGVTNPLPLNLVKAHSDVVIGIDVHRTAEPGVPVVEPSVLDAVIVSTEIMSQRLVDEAVMRHQPDVYVRADVGAFRSQEFWRVREIVESASADKDRFKRSVADALLAYSLRTEGRA